MEGRVQAYIAAGLPKAKAETAAKNEKVAASLDKIIANASITDASKNPKQGALLLHLATNGQDLPDSDQTMLAQLVAEGKIQTQDQLNGGLDHLKAGGDRSIGSVEKASGVGIVVSAEQIASNVATYMSENANALADTTWANLASAMNSLKIVEDLRWASPLDIKKSLESAFTATFGSKEEYNKASAAASKASKQQAKQATAASSKTAASGNEAQASTSGSNVPNMFEEGFLASLHPVGGNAQIREDRRQEHLKATGGIVQTRFPPEPNGYLHIGHSKAIAVNFGFAQYHGGKCYLRYDDTNPEAEEQVYIDSCLDIIRWLGFEPWTITYSSDNFQKLYELAVELIKRDRAYMCHCTAEQIHENRGGPDHGPRKACEHRTRPVQESLDTFERMKNGEFKPSEATLRMKQDLEDGNPQMWDLIAYRTLKKPHHRTGSTWCIYPTYDFTHCLCDSIENITHSLCTTEFRQSRISYDWLCDALEVYRPQQNEYGRLKLQGTFLSKRKILKLVELGIVKGWDDPRLYTLIALRRRGIPPGAILSFINGLGVTTSTTTIGTHRFEQAIRAYLELKTPRLMLVLKPLKLTLENVPEDYVELIDKPLHAKDASFGTNKLPLTRHLYIDATDFRTEDSKDFFRLAPGKTVGLLYAKYPITCTSFKTDEKTGEVIEVFARYEGFTGTSDDKPANVPKVKTYIHWVAEHAPSHSPVKIAETRIFKQLFKSDDPATLTDYVADVDPDSLQVVKGALLEVGLWDIIGKVKSAEKSDKAEQKALTSDPSAALSGGVTGGNERVRFQGLRTAYFCLDKEAKVNALTNEASSGPAEGDELILNWIVSLKEDKTK